MGPALVHVVAVDIAAGVKTAEDDIEVMLDSAEAALLLTVLTAATMFSSVPLTPSHQKPTHSSS